MLRNSELKTLVKQLNKSPRTSLLKEDERKALVEGLKQEIPKEEIKKGPKVVKQNSK